MKKKIKVFLSIFFGLSALTPFFFIGRTNVYLRADHIGTYSLLLSNPLRIEDDTVVTKTVNGNPILFKTNGSEGAGVISLSNNQYFYNTTRLTGIISFNVRYSGNGLTYVASHYAFENKEYEYIPVVSGDTVSLDGHANYIGFMATSDVVINELLVTYSCSYIKEDYTVSFNSNGGTPISSIIVQEGKTVNKPVDPEKEGFNFVTWCSNEELTNVFDFNTQIYSDTTLFAKYEAKSSPISLVSPSDNAYIDLRNDDIKNFLDNYSKGGSLSYQSNVNHYQNKPLTFSWSSSTTCDYYIIDISEDENFNSYDSYIAYSTFFSLKNAKTGISYYWQVRGVKNGVTYVSRDIRKVETANYPRLLDIDSVSNIRDIGGYTTSNGKVVKENMIIRSGTLDNVSEYGKKQLIQDLGIKTDLDLRNNGEGKSDISSPINAQNYFKTSFPYWTDETNGINVNSNWSIIKALMEGFANEDLYPINMHSSLGQDRTGTLAILIEGLLGMSIHDILVDYELSSFSKIVNENGIIPVTDKFTYQVDPTINYLKSFGNSSDSFQTCVINYLTNTVGVSSSTISEIQNILLEDR